MEGHNLIIRARICTRAGMKDVFFFLREGNFLPVFGYLFISHYVME